MKLAALRMQVISSLDCTPQDVCNTLGNIYNHLLIMKKAETATTVKNSSRSRISSKKGAIF